MSDSTDRLRQALADLHGELADSKSLNQDARALLDETLAEIRGALEQAPDEGSRTIASAQSEDHANLVSQLSEAARHFEESHPNLFGMVGSVIDALGRMGI